MCMSLAILSETCVWLGRKYRRVAVTLGSFVGGQANTVCANVLISEQIRSMYIL
jgi:hypothetical protein